MKFALDCECNGLIEWVHAGLDGVVVDLGADSQSNAEISRA
jgi:hypothetical protein